MTQTEVTKEEIIAVYPKVAETMADALGCDVEDVKLDVSLIEGLDAESIDFLDMVFRLERTFKIKIPRGKIVENARGDLPEAEFERKGIVNVDKAVDEDELMLVAADAGADDVEDGGDAWQVTTPPTDLHAVRTAIEDAGYKVASSDLTLIPTTAVELSVESQARTVLRLVDALYAR